jgi:predicted GIY-YIG superfamily endonuclease
MYYAYLHKANDKVIYVGYTKNLSRALRDYKLLKNISDE